jgi:hypothetical protein
MINTRHPTHAMQSQVMSRLKPALLSFLVLAAPLQADDPLEKDRTKHARSLEKLDDSLEAARRTHADGIEAAHRRLLEAFDKAIERASEDDDRKLATHLKAQRVVIAAEVPRPL